MVIGGGLPQQVGSSSKPVARAWPNPFQAVANMLNTIVTGLSRTFAQGADGEGTVAKKTTAADQQKVKHDRSGPGGQRRLDAAVRASSPTRGSA